MRLPAEAEALVWPECHDARTASACAEIGRSHATPVVRRGNRDSIPVCSLDRPMVVALTSPGDGDGKTSLLLALAPQLAQRIAGGILVVDANFRKPDLTVRLGLPEARRGGAVCAAILGGSPQPEAARPPVIYPTNLPRLNVLPASAGQNEGDGRWGRHSCLPRTDKNVCPTSTLASWIDELRADWPLVVLDAPSLAHAETAPLARCCDGAIWWCVWGTRRGVRWPRPPARSAQRRPTAGLPGGQVGTIA